MVSGAKKCSCTELTGKILSWPNVIQIFIRLDNLVKKIQMEKGRSIFFFLVLLSRLQMTRTIKNGAEWFVIPIPPHQHQEWAPWRVRWPRKYTSHTGGDLEAFRHCHDTRLCTMGAVCVKNQTLCWGRSNPVTLVTARWHGRVSESVNWDWERTAGKKLYVTSMLYIYYLIWFSQLPLDKILCVFVNFLLE